MRKTQSRSSAEKLPDDTHLCGEIERQLGEYLWNSEMDSPKETELLEKRLHFAKRLWTQLRRSQKLFQSEKKILTRKPMIAKSRDANFTGPEQIIERAIEQLDDWIQANQTLLKMTRAARARQRNEHFSYLDELVLGIYLHLRKHHFRKGESERIVNATIFQILESANISDVTRGKSKEYSLYINSATPLHDTPIGMRLNRIFKNSKNKRIIIKNMPTLPCEYVPIAVLPEKLLKMMDENQKYRANLLKSRP